MRERPLPGCHSSLARIGLLLLLMLPLRTGWAQQAPTPPAERKQPAAKSPEESAAYVKFLREQNPDEQIRLVEDFLLQYPNSELKEYAFQVATQAYQSKNDYARMLTYGEITLSENENNLTVLMILASTIPESTARNDADREEKLGEAERYAKRSLEVLAKLPKPARTTTEQWTQTKRDAEASSHAALGLIALIREEFATAELAFREAVELTPRPDPVLLYRLGLSYAFQKKYDLALEVLERAASLGGVQIARPEGGTRDLVAEAKEFALKSRSASNPSPAEAPVSSETEESRRVP